MVGVHFISLHSGGALIIYIQIIILYYECFFCIQFRNNYVNYEHILIMQSFSVVLMVGFNVIKIGDCCELSAFCLPRKESYKQTFMLYLRSTSNRMINIFLMTHVSVILCWEKALCSLFRQNYIFFFAKLRRWHIVTISRTYLAQPHCAVYRPYRV